MSGNSSTSADWWFRRGLQESQGHEWTQALVQRWCVHDDGGIAEIGRMVKDFEVPQWVYPQWAVPLVDWMSLNVVQGIRQATQQVEVAAKALDNRRLLVTELSTQIKQRAKVAAEKEALLQQTKQAAASLLQMAPGESRRALASMDKTEAVRLLATMSPEEQAGLLMNCSPEDADSAVALMSVQQAAAVKQQLALMQLHKRRQALEAEALKRKKVRGS